MRSIRHFLLLCALCLTAMPGAGVCDGKAVYASEENGAGDDGTVSSLYYAVQTENGRWRYSLQSMDGKIQMSRRASEAERRSSVFVHPRVLQRIAAWMKDFHVEQWRDFSRGKPRESGSSTYVSLMIGLGEGEEMISVHGNSARPDGVPAGFAEADRALRVILDEALCLHTGAVAKLEALPPRSLKRLSWGSSGMSMDDCKSYELYWRLDTEGPVMHLMRRRGDEVIDCAVTGAERETIEKMLAQHQIARWNGFSGTNQNVLDGSGFGLDVVFADGSQITAHGYMRFPDGYHAARQAVLPYFEELLRSRPGEDRS